MNPEESLPVAQLVIKLGYRGGNFSGFAFHEGVRTVEGELIQALSVLFHREVELTCAGRTDAGVHAISQYVNCPVFETDGVCFSSAKLIRSLQALTSQDIVIQNVYSASPAFSARFDALERQYRYRIATPIPATLAAPFSWWCAQSLDVDAMERAASYLVGTHDFTSFCKSASAVGKNCERTINEIAVNSVQELGEEQIHIVVRGTAFLHNMVRIIVGTLVQIGAHNRYPEDMQRIIEARDRRAAGPTAPACGLTFERVRYLSGALKMWDNCMRVSKTEQDTAEQGRRSRSE